jgi:hypothetical protein
VRYANSFIFSIEFNNANSFFSSAADPSVLSTYVTALLKNDKPREQLQKFCEEELEDFLHDGVAFSLFIEIHILV